MRHLRHTAVITALTAVLMTLSTGLAMAAPTPVPSVRAAVLVLTVTHPEATTSSTSMVVLSCDPAGGSHPTPAAACAELEARDGSITRDPGDTMCPMIYRPVTVEANGTWRGASVEFERTYGNDCQMTAATGTVFAF